MGKEITPQLAAQPHITTLIYHRHTGHWHYFTGNKSCFVVLFTRVIRDCQEFKPVFTSRQSLANTLSLTMNQIEPYIGFQILLTPSALNKRLFCCQIIYSFICPIYTNLSLLHTFNPLTPQASTQSATQQFTAIFSSLSLPDTFVHDYTTKAHSSIFAHPDSFLHHINFVLPHFLPDQFFIISAPQKVHSHRYHFICIIFIKRQCLSSIK